MDLSESASKPIEMGKSLEIGKEDSKIIDNKYFDVVLDDKLYILELSKSKSKDYISFQMSNYFNLKDNSYFFKLTIEKFREIYKLNSLFQNIDEIYGLLAKLIIDEKYDKELKFNSILLTFKLPMLIGEDIEAKFELKPKILNKEEIIENLCSKVSELITENKNLKNDQKAIVEELRNKNAMLEGEIEILKNELNIMKQNLENILESKVENIGYDNRLRSYPKQTNYQIQMQTICSQPINNQIQQYIEYRQPINNQDQMQRIYSQQINNHAQRQIEFFQTNNYEVQQQGGYSKQTDYQVQQQNEYPKPINNQDQMQRQYSVQINNQFQQQGGFPQPINNQDQIQRSNSQPINNQVLQQMAFIQPEFTQPINNQVQQKEEYSGEYQFQNKNAALESLHEHYANYIEILNECCKICLKKFDGQPGYKYGYKCGECPLIYCLECANKIVSGPKNKSVHDHPLFLKDRGNNRWKCDKCQSVYDGKDKASFNCRGCDFDVCNACYLK